MNEWHYLTWEEIGKRVKEGIDTAILPVGATEQHGPHLGCGVDTSIADHVAKKISLDDVFILPSLPYGCSIGHSKRWPGTIALQPKTLIDVVKDIGDWAYATGVRRLFLLNAHVTNFAPLRCALEMLRAEHDDLMVALINTSDISDRVKLKHHADADDWHANDAETSLMMFLDEEMVREEKCNTSDDPDRTHNHVFAHPVNRTSANGVTGTPSKASQEKGQTLFANMVSDLDKIIQKGIKEAPPLDVSYTEKVEI